ncbi:MAG: hypothetical protein JSU90_00705 [Nitrospiraceae bacterium]|nr:MAG: hypothetical protein JSU90_00705 [Nitrospiraceae bacterium]
MKDSQNHGTACCDLKDKSKLKELWHRQVHKIKKGTFTCPFCKEVFAGLSAFGAHLKKHCT